MHCGAVVRWAPHSLRLMGACSPWCSSNWRSWLATCASTVAFVFHPSTTAPTHNGLALPATLLCRRQRVAAASWTILSRSGVRDTDWERREGGLSDGPMLSVEVIECTLHAMGGPR